MPNLFVDIFEVEARLDKLKIFISSTQTDLQLERNAVNSIIEQLGHDCLRAETYCAPGMSSHNSCKQKSQECDIYIGIYGPIYGSVPPGLGISVTEMEYNTAKEHDPKKIIIYIKMSDTVEAPQLSFLSKVQEFSEGYFRHAKFSNIDELREFVKQDLVTWTTRQVRESLALRLEVNALHDKVAYLNKVMNSFKIPKGLQ